MDDRLVVLMGSRIAGELTRRANGVLRFEYDEHYVASDGATPISLSMPLAVPAHVDTRARPVVSNVLWGLLPDNERVLERWASRFQVRRTSPFFLLGTPVGEDCAGAIGFCSPDRVDDYLGRRGEVSWLTPEDLEDHIHELARDRAAWLGRDFAGQFSLAGAQAKTAVRFQDGRWGIPSGNEPTTHIIKPASLGLDDQDIDEHLCLDAARRVDLVCARSRIQHFGEVTAIVVDRFDRRLEGDRILRVHQEDICQALGLGPDRKYQRQGGPGAADVANLLLRSMPASAVKPSLWRFADALAWNWVVAGTDAHAKNYGVMLAGQEVLLAPLYDISSILPYLGRRGPDGEYIHIREQRLAMKIGSEYSLEPLRNTWPGAAADLSLPADALLDRVRTIVREAPDAFADAVSQPEIAVLKSDLPKRLLDAVAERAARCLKVL